MKKKNFEEYNLSGEWIKIANLGKCDLYNCETNDKTSVVVHSVTGEVISKRKKMSYNEFQNWAKGINNIIDVQDFNESQKKKECNK